MNFVLDGRCIPGKIVELIAQLDLVSDLICVGAKPGAYFVEKRL